MKNILVGLSIGLLTSASVAQIPMSKYVRTFTKSLTRGYFFQAPVDFVVTHLEVPDETNKGEYLVALYKLRRAPPPFSWTLAIIPTFYKDGIKSNTKAMVPATAGAFKKGDWVAVLGAAGKNTGGVANSYGASGGANNPSAILGVTIAVGLQRCGMQINIGTSKGVGRIWSDVHGPICRVKMTVRLPTATKIDGSQSCIYCPGSNGKASLDICATNPAIAGKTMKLEMKSSGTTNTGAVLAFGILRANIPVPGFGRLCMLRIVGIVPFSGSAIPSGPVTGAQLSIPIPGTISVLGTKIVFQGALVTAAPTIPLTNGLEIIVGK